MTLLLGLALVSSVTVYKGANAQEPTFLEIDLTDVDPTLTDPSKSKNADDFPFGIECNDPQFVYVTIFKQGLLAKINKSTRIVEQFFDQPDEQVVSGQNLYSITRDDNTGNLFMNEVGNGELWRFEPASSAWTRIPLVEEIVDPLVTYPFGYDTRPNILRVDESGAPDIPPNHSPHIYEFGLTGFEEVIYANGNIWVALSYKFDFDQFAEAVDVTDVEFAGLIRINPITLEVTRIEIPDAVEPTGLAVDADEPSILWLTDKQADKIYKFDTEILIVTQTITNPLIDEPRGIDNDQTSLYVALNKPAVDDDFDFIADNNSEIAVIDKQTQTVTIIDTGASIGDAFLGFGTFNVVVAGPDILAWTDQAADIDPDTGMFVAHVGTIDLTTFDVEVFNTDFAVSNHFGCVPFDGEFWWAGQGSANVGILPNSKFSGGRPVRATSSGGGGGGVYRGRDFAFGNPDDPRYDSNAPVIEEVLVQEGSLKILAKITDTVGVEGVQAIIDKKLFSMSRHDGSQSWWYRVFTSDDLPAAGDTLLVKIVAWDYNKNKVEHSVTVDIPFGALSSHGASFAIRPLSVVNHQAESTYSITASGTRPNDQT
ncbi:MAG: hypothetical protein ACRD38_05500, partial [Nitrososphaerales archaeon]